jgi:hypothetical protein
MTDILKPLGQAAPSATTETDLYTVPDETMTTVSSLVVCNRAGTAGTVRVSVSVGGAATTDKDYLLYDKSVAANDYITLVIGITIKESDVMRVYASSGDFSFNLFGVETS